MRMLVQWSGGWHSHGEGGGGQLPRVREKEAGSERAMVPRYDRRAPTLRVSLLSALRTSAPNAGHGGMPTGPPPPPPSLRPWQRTPLPTAVQTSPRAFPPIFAWSSSAVGLLLVFRSFFLMMNGVTIFWGALCFQIWRLGQAFDCIGLHSGDRLGCSVNGDEQ